MRKFSEEEKEIIRKLVASDGASRNIIHLLDGSLRGVRVVVNRNPILSELKFEADRSKPDDIEIDRMAKRQDEISKTILLYASLINHLEKSNLILLYKPAGSNNGELEFGQGAANIPSVTFLLNDESLARLILDYSDKEIIPTYQLQALVSDSFETPEEKRFKKQMCVAWTAIVVAIAIGVASVAIGACCKA